MGVEKSSPEEQLTISITALVGLPEIAVGDNLADLILDGIELFRYDVVVVTQKVVSKAEGRTTPIDTTMPLQPQLDAIIESESRRIIRKRDGLLITETHSGFICANAGIDQSNMPEGTIGLLPKDPDRSARRIRDRIMAKTGVQVGVVISDTFGRTWRRGVQDIALGVAGIAAVVDLRGTLDAQGRELSTTQIALADELAGAAELVKSKDANIPVVVIRGVPTRHFRESSIAAEVIRPYSEDLFR